MQCIIKSYKIIIRLPMTNATQCPKVIFDNGNNTIVIKQGHTIDPSKVYIVYWYFIGIYLCLKEWFDLKSFPHH